MKRAVCLLLCAVMLLCLCGCSNKSGVLPGTGTPGVVETLEWSGFDELIEQSQQETDLEKRSLLLHEAEDMLMKSGAVIPLVHGNRSYLLKPDISGVYQTASGTLYFNQICRQGDPAGKSIQVSVCGEPVSLDYVLNMASDIAILVANTSAGLMRETEDGQCLCDMAESYEVSDDGLTYTFHLRPDLKWSDGAVLNADDFEYSWRRAAANETAAQSQYMYDVIRGYPDNLELSVSDDKLTLQVVLNQPCAYFLSICANPSYFPVYRKQVEGAEGYRDSSGKLQNPGAWASEGGIVTCGAYTIERWNHNESIIFEKNPFYYKASEIPTETIHLMLTSDSATAYNSYEADSIVLTNMIPDDLVDSMQENPEYHVKDLLVTTNLAFNLKSPLFYGMTAEEAAIFRRALGYAIDRSFLSQVAVSSKPDPAISNVPPNISDGTGKHFGDGYDYSEEKGYYSIHSDLDKAREMLKSIGFQFDDDGKLKDTLTVDYLFNGSGSNVSIAACLQADLAQLGINLNLQQMEWNVFLGERRQAKTESYRDAWTSDFNDPYGMLNIFTSYSSNNSFRLGQ